MHVNSYINWLFDNYHAPIKSWIEYATRVIMIDLNKKAISAFDMIIVGIVMIPVTFSDRFFGCKSPLIFVNCLP